MADTTLKTNSRRRRWPLLRTARQQALHSSAASAELRPEKTRSRHLSFAFRLGLAMSFIAIASALVLVYLAVRQHYALAQAQSDAFGATIAEQLATSLVEPIFTDDYLTVQLGINQLASKPLVSAVAVYHAEGELIASSTAASARGAALAAGAEDAIDIPALLSGAHQVDFSLALASLPAGYYFAPVNFSGATAAYAVVALNRSPVRSAFDTSSKDLLIAVGVISLLSIIGAYWLSLLLSRPVSRLKLLSSAVQEGRAQSLKSLLPQSQLGSEWKDILSVYERLGNEIENKQEVEKLLQQFVAVDVAEQLLEEGGQMLGESVDATVLFVDIVNFTRIAEPMSPEDVAKLLNRYLSMFANCARIYRGTVDKFIGDAAMIVFGTPRRDKDHRLHAVACAAAIQAVAREINRKRQSIGLRPIELRVGVNSGKMRAGILGSDYRKEFTVVGDSVNLASRLCNTAGPGEILVSDYVRRQLEEAIAKQHVVLENAGTISVKGKEQPVAIYQLHSARLAQNWVVTNLIEDIVAQH